MFIKKRIKSLLSAIRDLIPIVAFALLILVNLMRIRSFVIGTVASIAYIVVTGYYIGKVFLVGEDETFVRWMFGIFLVLCLFLFVGTPIVVLYQLDVLGLAAVLFASPVLLLAKTLLWPNLKDSVKKKQNANGSRFSPMYLVYAGLIAYSIFLLLKARSGWVYGTVWTVVSPSFFVVYFLAAFVLLGIILYSKTRSSSKILLTILFSLVSSIIFALVLYPGHAGDPADHLGLARLIYSYGNLKRGFPLTAFHIYWALKEKGLALLSAVLSKMLSVDVYWVHTFIQPVMWSSFIPLAAYKIGKLLDWKNRAAILAGFLTSFYTGFAGWASRSTGNSLGFVPFFVSLCFSLWYMKMRRRMLWFLAVFTALVSTIVHPLTGTMAFIFIIVVTGLRIHKEMVLKHGRVAHLLLLSILACGFLVIIALFGINTLIYRVLAPQYAAEASTALSFETLLSTDVWDLVFGEYMTYSFKDLVLSFFVPFLGLVGLVYALKRAKRHNSKLLVWSMLIVFVLCIVEYRFLKYGMVNVLFGPGRLWTFRDLIGVPFVAFVIVSIVEYFEGAKFGNPFRSIVVLRKWSVRVAGRYVLTWLFIGLALSALATASIKKNYEWLRGLQPTALEVEAVKYIDENTDGRYVVLTVPTTTQVGWGVVGVWNYLKFYHYSAELGKLPSVADMMDLMSTYEAGVGYFIASFRTPNLEKTLEDASRMYGLFKVLSNEKGKIYIFNYKIPPLPPDYPNPDADVMAFDWSTPPGFFVQNGLFRVILGNESLDVRDFWGDLYESIDFQGTSMSGKPIGNMMSIDRYDPSLETWIEWNLGDSITPDSQLQFRLNFESDSLIGVVARSSPYVRLWWESGQESTLSLQTGDFKRLYIPGLVGGLNSYNVSSRNFGMLYTFSQTDNVVLNPAYGTELNTPFLTFNQIKSYCNLTITQGYLSYDFWVHNNAEIGQWAYIEMWLPDEIYSGTPPPLSYSLDGGLTWSGSLIYTDFPRGIPLKTVTETEVNWVLASSGKATETPGVWRFYTAATGGFPVLPETFTDSGGGQNRILLGLYLPAGDRALLKWGISVYYVLRPLKMSYVFTDSDNVIYGLRNLSENLIRFYNHGPLEYVGGLTLTEMPTFLSITENTEGKIESALITLPANTTFNFYAAKEVDTRVDENGDGIPDRI